MNIKYRAFSSTALTLALLSPALQLKAGPLDDAIISDPNHNPTQFEIEAAAANQQTYDELALLGCQDININGDLLDGCPDLDTFLVWENVRHLVHTANDILGAGPTLFSLNPGSGAEGLGFALRWSAAEEFAAQGNATGDFSSNQLSGLSSRLSALRAGATGFSIGNYGGVNTGVYAYLPNNSKAIGGSAGDDSAWSRLGGFVNFSFSSGEQDQSPNDAAYDYDADTISAGVDYRLNSEWVIGSTFAYSYHDIAFNQAISISEGYIEMDAWSIMPFALWQKDDWFASLSAGLQLIEFTSDRYIRYPSNNVIVHPVNTRALSSNDAEALSASGSAGYTWRPKKMQAFSLEPSITLNMQKITIDGYTENDIENDGFNFIVDEQKIDSMETAIGIKAQYVFSNRFGVFIPFADLQFYAEHETDDETIDALYANASGSISNASKFRITSDGAEADYKVFSFGVSAVVRGARQKNFGEPAGGGIQLFIKVSQLEDVKDYTQDTLTLGGRYEF